MSTECKREKLEVQPCGARQVIKECGERGGSIPGALLRAWALDILCPKRRYCSQSAPTGRGIPAADQPGVQPWVDVAPHTGVLKQRRMDIDHKHVLRPDTSHSLGHVRRSLRTEA